MHAAFSPDGSRVVTASGDGTASIWEAESGAEIAVLSGHEDDIEHAAFSPDSQRIITTSLDGTARLWWYFPTTQSLIDYTRCIVPRQLTKKERVRFFLDPEPSSGTRLPADLDCEQIRQ